ncbi:MAG: lipopolysaccharide biosynthesis protein [Christensenella sp.]|nr:lipopolysaccharide biosynthesis protein [Christensenella sp.]
MDSTIRNKTISGVIWKAMESGGNQLVKLVISVVLARMLDPQNYKTLTFMLIIIDFADTIVKRGFVTSLVQHKDADNVDFSSVLWIMLALAGIFYTAFYFGAPMLAKINVEAGQDPVFVPALRVIALSLFFGAFNSVQGAIIQRKLEFRLFCISTLVTTLISGAIGICMAYLGYGIWALVVQQIIGSFSNVVVLWLLDRWKPMLVFSLEKAKSHFSFGWKLLLSSLLDKGYNSISSLIIYARFADASLAFYGRGKQYAGMISENLNSVALSVLFPAYARHQDDVGRVREMVRKTNRSTSLMIVPMMAGLAVIATPFVHVLLTDKWLPTVPYLQMMCIAYLFYPMEATDLQALLALGRSDVYLKTEIIKKVFGISALAAAVFSFQTAIAISWSYVITCVFSMIVTMVYMKKFFAYRWRDQIWDMTPPVLLSIAMCGAVYGVSLLPMPEVVSLILQVVCGIAVYLGLAVIFKLESFTYLWTAMCKYFKKNRASQPPACAQDGTCVDDINKIV